jgi:hypothetical protein
LQGPTRARLWIGVLLLLLGVAALLTADRVAAGLLGIGPTPYSYRDLREASTHANLATLIDVAAVLASLSGLGLALSTFNVRLAAPQGPWGRRVARSFVAILPGAAGLGYLAGLAINTGGARAGDQVVVASWFVLFPLYILADSILNARFVHCALRAAALPLAEGLVIWFVTRWPDPLAVATIVAALSATASVLLVGATRAVRKR